MTPKEKQLVDVVKSLRYSFILKGFKGVRYSDYEFTRESDDVATVVFLNGPKNKIILEWEKENQSWKISDKSIKLS